MFSMAKLVRVTNQTGDQVVHRVENLEANKALKQPVKTEQTVDPDKKIEEPAWFWFAEEGEVEVSEELLDQVGMDKKTFVHRVVNYGLDLRQREKVQRRITPRDHRTKADADRAIKAYMLSLEPSEAYKIMQRYAQAESRDEMVALAEEMGV